MIQMLTVSTEALVGRVNGATSQQLNAGDEGVILQQIKAGTALANSTTETSLFTISALAPSIVGNPSAPAPTILPAIPGNFLFLGTWFRVKIYGTIATTGTPTLRIRAVLKNTAGTVAYTLSDSTATTLGAITGTTELLTEVDIVTSSLGTSGSLTARSAVTYGTTSVLNTVIKAAAAAVTVDTTQQYTLDVLATWGTASSSNTLNTLLASVEIL
jgi:hypothetical protein